MKSMRTMGFLVALAILASGDVAHAAGVSLDASALAPAVRDRLRADIAAAHAEVPELVRQVREIASHAGEIEAAGRTRAMPLTPHFKGLGPRALFPMLELLAFDGSAARAESSAAKTALRVGLLEAVGSIRDARAVPVVALVLDGARDEDTIRAAAASLGRIGTDDAVAAVLDAARRERAAQAKGSARERAILSGMHDCLRSDVAKHLATRLDEATDAETVRVLAKSLGGVGNIWAWASRASRDEEAVARSTASAALVRAFLRHEGETREAIGKAILVVRDPSTARLVAEAKRTLPDHRPALEQLERRLAVSGVR